MTLTVINLNVLLRRTAPTDEEEVPDEGSLVVNAACSTDICRSMEIDGKTVVIVLHNNDMCKEPIFVQVVCTVVTPIGSGGVMLLVIHDVWYMCKI